MKVKIIDNADEFALLKEPWDRLLSGSGSATVFNSWEWNYYWWKHYGESKQLRILSVFKDNVIVAIAPFFLSSAGLPGPLATVILQFLGSCEETSPDYLDMLCLPEHEAETSKLLADYVLNRWDEWDVLKWTDMPEGSLLYQSLINKNNSKLQSETGIYSRISRTELPESWEIFLSRKKRKKRNKIRNRRRHMIDDVNGEFFVWNNEGSLDEALNTLIKLHRNRMLHRSVQGAFSTNASISFHRDIMKAFQARNWLRLYYIRAGDNIIAMDYCFRFKKRIMQYQRGFDSAYYDRSPGFVLMSHCFEEAINEGNVEFDFLKGEYDHKKEFETHSVNTVYLTTYRNTFPARSYRLGMSMRANLKAIVKDTKLGNLIKKFRDRDIGLPQILAK